MHQFNTTDNGDALNHQDDSIFIYDCPEKTNLLEAVKEIKNGVKSFHMSMSSLKLNQFQTDSVYKIVSILLQKSADFYINLVESDSSLSIQHAIHQSTDLIISQLNENATVHKRQKHYHSNDLFIEPKELAI